tara:strand:+ start:352 stop:1068 length:717 start_codon:yes stop_codon:yes gene_type:complete
MRISAVSAAMSWLAARYIRLVWATGRWRIDDGHRMGDLVAGKTPAIACFWHGRMLMMPNAWRYDAPISILISQHRDGRLISNALAFLDIGTIAGSTSRGGGSALIGIVRTLKRGGYIGITPDGPRGPRMRVARGAAMAARLTGAPLVPVTFAAKWRIVASSWDRMVIPLPFTRGIVRMGEPIAVPPDTDKAGLDLASRRLEEVLIRMTNEIDAELGVETVHPAPEGERPGRAAAEGAP